MIKAKNQLQGQLNASIIHEYPELENVEITPAVEDKVYKSDMYGFDEVLVKGVQAYIDEDIKPEYIKEGVDILGVVGNVVELKGEEKVITPKTTLQTILPSENKNAITKITVQPVDRTIDADIQPENIVEGVEILGVIGNYKGVDTRDATVTPDKVLEGTTVYINNEKIEGTLPNNGQLEYVPSDDQQEVPEGYTSGGVIQPANVEDLQEYKVCLALSESILSGISMYTRLEYIESVGNQYIVTDYYGNGKSCCEMRYSNLIGVGQMFGAHNSGSENGIGAYTNTTGNYHFWFQYHGNYDSGIDAYNVTSATVILDCGNLYVNDKSYKLGVTKTFTINYPLYIFAGNLGGALYDPVPMRLHEFVIKEDNVVLHNYIPVIHNVTKEIGLYDVVSNKFHKNMGTGTFLAGPVVEEV